MTYDPGKDPAFPLPIGQHGPIGLTKREHFAALILAGMCSNSAISMDCPFEDMARTAINQADELLEQLGYSSAVLAASEVSANEVADRMAMDELRSEFAPTLLVEVGDE